MGELLGVQMQARKIAKLAYDVGITDAHELVTAVAVCLAESQGFDRAYNDNVDDQGRVISRDVGLWEINIPASKIGSQDEEDLYDRENNAAAMYALYKNRKWQPWAAFNSDVYLHSTYIERAALAVQNYLAERLVVMARLAGQTPRTRIPMVSLAQLNKLYQ
jgi:hypothetical protein